MSEKSLLHIDGSAGEGGGQILRSALALSLITGKPFRIDNIRAGRSKPGLLRQHLTALTAATAIGNADVEGAEIGSKSVLFHPGTITPGNYQFSVGTAGSATLVLQTVLPALLMASSPTTLVCEGGTHNPAAPPFHFLSAAFLPLVNRMGPRVTATLERHGFYPAGGGRFRVVVEPAAHWQKLHLTERGESRTRHVTILIASLSQNIARREKEVVHEMTGWPDDTVTIHEIRDSAGPGNCVIIECAEEHITEVFVAFGEKGVPAGIVAEKAVTDFRQWLAAGVPVGKHLADQLLLPMALAGGGTFSTLSLSRHSQTNIGIIRQFLDIAITVEPSSDRTSVVTIG